MINTQIIAMHFPSATVHRPISTADTRETLRTPIAGGDATIHGQRTLPDESLRATPTASTAEPREEHFSLQTYLEFLETQRERMETYAKEG